MQVTSSWIDHWQDMQSKWGKCTTLYRSSTNVFLSSILCFNFRTKSFPGPNTVYFFVHFVYTLGLFLIFSKSVQHHLSIPMCIRAELGRAVTPEVPLQITGEMSDLEVLNDAFWRGYKPFVICLLSKSPEVSKGGFIAWKAAERLQREKSDFWTLVCV